MPTQLPRVPSLIPSSFATLAIGRDVSITIFTASSLNSGEKLFLGRGNYFTFPDSPSYWMDCPEGSGHLSFPGVGGGGAVAARAQRGDPCGRGVAQVVGGGVVRAVIVPLRRGVVIAGGRSAAAAAFLGGWGAVAPGAGTCSGGARVGVAGAVW